MEKSPLTPQSKLPMLDIDALETVEDIKKTILKIREEQENLILSQNKIVSNYTRDVGIDKIFEQSCLISMVRRTPYLLGTWPVAIVGSVVNKSVGLGNFESYGSLWRFVRVSETSSDGKSVRVALECSEIGEKPLYLTSNLDLSENNNYAAEWWATKSDSKDDFTITLHTVDDKRFLCAHEDAVDLALIADDAALSQVTSSKNDLSADVVKPAAFFSSYWNYEWAVTSEDAITMSSSKLEESLRFLNDVDDQNPEYF